MSAAMTQAISVSLARLEPDLRAAADRAAGRAGMALDAWIAAKLRERAGPDAAPRPPGREGARIPPMAFEDGPGEREGTVDGEPDDRDDALLRGLKRSLRDLQDRMSGPTDGGSIDGVGSAGDEAESAEHWERVPSPADPAGPDRSFDERHGGRRVENDLAQSVERLSARLETVAQDHAAMLAQAVQPLIAAARAAIPPNVVAGVAERLDGIDERLRRAEGSEDRLEPIEAKLRALAEGLGEAGAPSAAASLASFRRAVDDLSSRVDALHEGTLEAVERAVKGAVAEAIGPPPPPSHPDTVLNLVPDGGAQAGAADQGIEDALRAVHRTLEAVATRLATAGGNQDDKPAASGEFDGPIEPGAERSQPVPRVLAQAETDDAAVGDIKAGFIAAARRATRNAAGAGLPDGPPAEAGRSAAPVPSAPAGPARVAAARLKFALGRYRGALVLGLATAAFAGEAVPVGPLFA